MNQIKLSSTDWSFAKNITDFDAYYRKLRELGYTAVEMIDPSRDKAAAAAELKVLNTTCPHFPGLINRVEQHEQAIIDTRDGIRRASERGISQVVVLCGNRKGMDDETGKKNCITALKAVAGDAEKAGVVLTFEVFNRFDHQDYQADYGEFAFDVVRGVSSSSVKVLYDLYHMHRMGENVAEVASKNLPLIAHLHVAGSPKRNYPGPEQEMDYRKIFQTIHQAGYRGFWGIEFIPAGDPLVELSNTAKLFQSFLPAGA